MSFGLGRVFEDVRHHRLQVFLVKEPYVLDISMSIRMLRTSETSSDEM